MAYVIDTLLKGAGPDAHVQLLGVLKTLAESVGWTTLRYDIARAEPELILRSMGTTGREEILVGVQCYQDVAADLYNLHVGAMTGFLADRPFAGQPGFQGASVPCHNQAIGYVLTANPRRIIGCCKVGSPVYVHFYLGKLLAYARPGEYPSPLVVAGHAPGRALKRYSDPHWFPYKGRKGSTDPGYDDGHCYLRTQAGEWKTLTHAPFGNGHVNDTGYYALAGDYTRGTGALTRCLVPAGNTYQPQPIELYETRFGAYDPATSTYPSAGNLYGALDGVTMVSGYNLASEAVLQLGGTPVDQRGMSAREAVAAIRAAGGGAHVVLQDGARTSWRDFIALEMT